MEQQMVETKPRKSKKESKNSKKKQPLKVVYITNPMKFTATASEFRALVQELTGQDADVPDISRFAASEGAVAAAAAAAAAAEGGAHAKSEVGGAAAGEKATSTSESYEEYGFCGEEMIEEFLGLGSDRLWDDEGVDVDDVFKRLGAF